MFPTTPYSECHQSPPIPHYCGHPSPGNQPCPPRSWSPPPLLPSPPGNDLGAPPACCRWGARIVSRGMGWMEGGSWRPCDCGPAHRTCTSGTAASTAGPILGATPWGTMQLVEAVDPLSCTWFRPDSQSCPRRPWSPPPLVPSPPGNDLGAPSACCRWGARIVSRGTRWMEGGPWRPCSCGPTHRTCTSGMVASTAGPILGATPCGTLQLVDAVDPLWHTRARPDSKPS